MGMSTHVVGIIPADERFKKMKMIYDLCTEQGVEIPDEVDEFFEGEPPNDNGVRVNIKSAVEVYKNNEYLREGYDIYVEKLPAEVKIIRVYNSY